MKLSRVEKRLIKDCIIHAPDPGLIKMKQGCEFMMAAGPRNRSESLLSLRPEQCVHLSEQLLASDESCSGSETFLLVCLREGKEVTTLTVHHIQSQ